MKNIFCGLLFIFLAGRIVAQQKGRAVSAEKGSAIVYDTLFKPASKIVYRYVGRMPEFDTRKNGSLNDYLRNRISFPSARPEEVPDGKVVVQFLIEESGHVSHPRVVKSAGLAFDSIAVRLMQQMPDWIPGRNDAGKAIPVEYTLPVRVCLD